MIPGTPAGINSLGHLLTSHLWPSSSDREPGLEARSLGDAEKPPGPMARGSGARSSGVNTEERKPEALGAPEAPYSPRGLVGRPAARPADTKEASSGPA